MRTFEVISPIDQSTLLKRTYADEAEIELVLSQTQGCQKNWKETSVADRIVICKRAIEILVEEADEIGEEITRQMGRPIRYSPFEVKGGVTERADYMMDIAHEALRTIDIDPLRYIKKEAHGCVLVLAPWNYPFLTSVNVIVPALVSGNSVLLKHSDQTPLTAERYQAAFKKAGLPEGVFNHLHIDHGQVAKLIQDPRINYVAFTGSFDGGLAVQKALGNRFIASNFELGGNDAAYVRADALIPHAAENLVDGAFFNSGQSCCGIERIYVHANVYDDFLDAFISTTKEYKMANPLNPDTTIGPMVRRENAKRVEASISAAIAKGARRCINQLSENREAYLFPEVLTQVDHNMDVMSQETFGPVVGIMKVKSDAEALLQMNDSDYGLTASIWSVDENATRLLGNDLEVGTVFMNRCDYLDPALAWTGMKNSGRGFSLSKLGYDALTRPKSFHLRKI